MKPTLNDKLIAYLTLISGLAISGVAEYYSIMGLIAIYPAAFWPVVIMGVVLGLGKISGTVWLKQNWDFAPVFLKTYILPAIVVMMMITSLGVFGFLSKAHSDQSLVSGDVQSKIAVYDEKIKTAKENIDANRKALKQMDEAVDQVMARSSSETGADKAVGIRRSQQKERARLQSEIQAEQKTIGALSEERAPIAAEVRKVEAEVGPIKYIAHLLYGENPDANILEKAVIWVTVLIVIVLDPLAVILLLASQYSFQRFRKLEEGDSPVGASPVVDPSTTTVANLDDLEPVQFVWKDQEPVVAQSVAELFPEAVVMEETKQFTDGGEHPSDTYGYEESVIEEPAIDYQFIAEDTGEVDYLEVPAEITIEQEAPVVEVQELERPGDYLTEVTGDRVKKEYIAHESGEYVIIDGQTYSTKAIPAGYIQNEEQKESNVWTSTVGNPITQEEYIKETQKKS